MAREIGRISNIDPKVARYLEAIKENIGELTSGGSRAVRLSEMPGIVSDLTDNIAEVVIPAVRPIIDQEIAAVRAEQTSISTLSEELLGAARFGSLIASGAYDAKTLTVNVNGHIAGYAVAVREGADQTITSDFIIQADRFAVVFPNPLWLPGQAYSLGQYVSASIDAGVHNIIFECTTNGTSGSSEPAWDTTPGNTTNDNTVVWTARTIDERVPFVVGNVGGTPTVGIDGNLVVDGTILTESLEAEAVTADKIASPLVLTHQIVIDPTGYIRSGQSAYDTGTGWFWGNNGGTPVFSIGNPAANKVTWDGATLTVIGNVSGSLDAASISGDVGFGNLDLALFGWTFTGDFSASDANTVAWGAGTFRAADGTTYSIGVGNTGNMTAWTYIYLDIAVSTTAFQITTNPATAVGAGKVLIAAAEDRTDEAFFQVFGGRGGMNLTANELAANAVVTNTLNAGAVTAAKMASSLTFTNELLLSSTGKIRVGKTSASSTTSGIWIGTDGASGWDVHVGDSTSYVWWDDSANLLSIVGNIFIKQSYSTYTPASYGGFQASSDPTINFRYVDVGDYIFLWVESQSLGTSNAGTFTILDWPSALQPASTRRAFGIVDANGAEVGYLSINNSAVVSVNRYDGSAFPSSGNKGLREFVTFYRK